MIFKLIFISSVFQLKISLKWNGFPKFIFNDIIKQKRLAEKEEQRWEKNKCLQ